MKFTIIRYVLLATHYSLAAEWTSLVTKNTTYDSPKLLNVELLFPQNQTYRPQLFTPVVFAFRNTAAFWPFDFTFRWDMSVWDPVENRTRSDFGGFYEFTHDESDSILPGNIEDPFLVLNYTALFNNIAGTSHGFLRWEVGFPNNCSFDIPVTEQGRTGIGPGVIIQESMEFTITNSTAFPLPTLNATDGCSDTIGTFSIIGEREVNVRSYWNPVSTCPVVQQVANSEDCGLKIDNALATRVVDFMENEAFGNSCVQDGPKRKDTDFVPSFRTWYLSDFFIAYSHTGAECGDVGVGVGNYISSSLAEYAHGCVDGKLYYLVDPDGAPKSFDAGQWTDNSYSEPNGLKTVANGDWLGLTVEDMITSAVEFTQKYGNRKKPEEHTDASFSETWDDVWEVLGKNIVAAPGVIDVPVCKESEAWDNWLNRHGESVPRYYQYPCNG